MKALVLGAGGFIGGHLCMRLKQLGYHVTGVDIKEKPNHEYLSIDEYIPGDLRDDMCWEYLNHICIDVDEVYQLAADMGGSQYIESYKNDASIMINSGIINMRCARFCIDSTHPIKIFYASSSCVYPAYNQQDIKLINMSETSAYPAYCSSNYGWEKLFSERVYLSLLPYDHISVRIARIHNCYGKYETFGGIREKAPVALCRKIASTPYKHIEILGDGKQIRTFMYIGDCIEGIIRLMNSDIKEPINLGYDEPISINGLAKLISFIAQKEVLLFNIVRDDNSLATGVPVKICDNKLMSKKLGWIPRTPLTVGMSELYYWVKGKVDGYAKEAEETKSHLNNNS